MPSFIIEQCAVQYVYKNIGGAEAKYVSSLSFFVHVVLNIFPHAHLKM